METNKLPARRNEKKKHCHRYKHIIAIRNLLNKIYIAKEDSAEMILASYGIVYKLLIVDTSPTKKKNDMNNSRPFVCARTPKNAYVSVAFILKKKKT